MSIKTYFNNVWLPYTQMKHVDLPPLAIKTKGCKITLNDGTKLIDGIASWWSVCHGYNHPYIIKKTKQQLKKMPHVMFAGLANKPAYQLANKLTNFVNRPDHHKKLAKVFFSDSGSTAVEVAIKMAVQYFFNQDEKTTKNKILSFTNGYHGDTIGSMSLCDSASGMHKKFAKILPKQFSQKIPHDQKELVKFTNFITKNQKNIAALIIEPLLQCAGGMKFHNPDILEKITKIAQENNILVIFDECATGFYRLGKKFAFYHTNITPDILLVGKALTGGIMTLAATITNEDIYNKFLDDSIDKALMHGPTFMGNPLACAAANASLDLFIKNDYSQKAQQIEKVFTEELAEFKQYKLIKNIRIKGAVATLQLHDVNWDFIFTLRKKLLAQKIWLRPFADVIYFMPPLTISKKEIITLVKATKQALAEV
jgi:adenosylmethionine-8-amino-7-oxononanoate aminotransferase